MAKTAYTRKNADKHHLYQLAVQNPDYDAEFVYKMYKKLRKKPPQSMKEDFCGTFAFSCEWVKLNGENKAVGVDIDPVPLKWGRENNLEELEEEDRKRVQLIKGNVLDFSKPKVDIVCAFNFSYFIFRTREDMRSYFRTAYRSLKPDGVMFLDAFGGSEAFLEQEERRKCNGFTYVWEQARYNPISAEMLCKIHFEFTDGTAMRNAFTYGWRLWTIKEIRELLTEAGFADVQIYWEGTDHKTGSGNGVFRKTEKGEACQAWIAYIVALK